VLYELAKFRPYLYIDNFIDLMMIDFVVSDRDRKNVLQCQTQIGGLGEVFLMQFAVTTHVYK